MRQIIFIILASIIYGNLISAQTDKYLTAPEVFKILDKSSLSYNITSLDQLDSSKAEDYYENMFMHSVHHTEFPKVINNEKGIALEVFSFDSLAWKEVQKGEEYFKIKDYAKALEHYEAAVEISDSCYIAYLYAGDCLLEFDNPQKALEYYEKAKAINPFDYRCWFFCGTANFRLGKNEEAKSNYLHALSLKPGHKNLINVLENLAPMLGIHFENISFKPKGGININGNKIDVYVTMSDGGIWMPYVLSKAMLKCEKEQRIKYVGNDSTKWSTEEEKQALYCLLSSYSSMKENGKIERDEYMERLLKILQEGYLQPFIIYAIAAKINPDVVLLLPEEVREEVEKFIKTFIAADI